MAPVGKTPTGSFRWRQAADEDAGRPFPTRRSSSAMWAPASTGVEFLHVNARRVLNEVPRAPFGFRWTVNAYRGCSHACTYCFARPTHTYLGFDMGHDFDTKIVVKVNAVERLRAESCATPLAGRTGGHGHQHRSLPTGRRSLSAHPGTGRRPGRGGQPAVAAHQVTADHA